LLKDPLLPGQISNDYPGVSTNWNLIPTHLNHIMASLISANHSNIWVSENRDRFRCQILISHEFCE
jgi:hypothetical protein